MTLLETLRTPKIGPFAVFDTATALAGMWIAAPYLGISRRRALWATIPIGVVTHAVLGIDTPLNRRVLGPGNTGIKLAVGALTLKAVSTD